MSEKDDLTRIKGIGPKYAAALRRAGIDSFEQLSDLSTKAINEIIGRRVARRNWIKQAQLLDSQTRRHEQVSMLGRTVDQILAAIDAKENKPRSKSSSEGKSPKKRSRKSSVGKSKIAEVESLLDRVADQLFAQFPEIISIDVGKPSSKKGASLPRICITIDNSKQPCPSQTIPDQIEGVPVEIVASNNGVFYLAAPAAAVGIQGGATFRRSAAPLGDGTIGVMVQDLAGLKHTPAFLTAGHVCRGGMRYVDDAVATMKRASAVVGEMRLTPRLYVENEVADAALVLVNFDIAPIPYLPGRSGLKFRAPRPSDVGAIIEKLGRNQVPGLGVIKSVSCGRTRLAPDFYNPVGYVVHHLLIERISGSFARGDSGAAIVLGRKWIIGFLRAVTDDGQLILASRVDVIQKNLVSFKMGTPQ